MKTLKESQGLDEFSREDRFLIAAYVLAIFLAYILLHGIYRPKHLAEPWVFSFVYNHFLKGIEHDVIVGGIIGIGYDGFTLFGKTFSYLYGGVLYLSGWTRSNAQLISVLMMVSTAVIWWALLKRLGFNRKLCVFFGLSLMLVEPFFGAANQVRMDALCFLLVSASLLLFLHHMYVSSTFLALVATEVHPVGIVSFFYMSAVIVSHLLSRSTPSKKIVARAGLRMALGVALGILYYLALHHRQIALLPSILPQANTFGASSGNFLTVYFFKMKYVRHLPELAFIITFTAWFVRKRYYRENTFIPCFILASLLFAIIVRRPTPMYIIYVYPAFLLLILWVLGRENRLTMGCVLILLYLLPQYTFVYILNRDKNPSRYVESLHRSVPSDGLAIFGEMNAYFAFVDRRFMALEYRLGFESLNLDSFYLLEDDDYRNGEYPQLKSFADTEYTSEQISSFSYLGETVVVSKHVRRLGGREPKPGIGIRYRDFR